MARAGDIAGLTTWPTYSRQNYHPQRSYRPQPGHMHGKQVFGEREIRGLEHLANLALTVARHFEETCGIGLLPVYFGTAESCDHQKIVQV